MNTRILVLALLGVLGYSALGYGQGTARQVTEQELIWYAYQNTLEFNPSGFW